MAQDNLPWDLPIHAFSTAAEYESFLEREHSTAAGIHLKIAKKSSGHLSITAPEAIETALCFGWIDGQANRFDEHWFLVRYTPRRQKSLWSRKNVETVGRLMGEGRIRPAGIAAVDAAKADGRWDRAYAGPATMTVPDDFAVALAADPAATASFDGSNKTVRYSILWRLESGSTKTREKRMASLIQSLSEGTMSDAKKKSAMKATGVVKNRNQSSAVSKRIIGGKAIQPVPVKDSVPVKRSGRLGLRSQSSSQP